MTARRSYVRPTAVVTAAVAIIVVLTSCANGNHNDQDVAFAQAMIPHHRQAVVMADLASSRATSPEVKTLAAKIKNAQSPEIATMSGWLEAWDETVPSTDMTGNGSSHSHMPGMMNDAAMHKLRKLSGTAFDTAFLQMMKEHHRGAITMARTELGKGTYRPARKLSKSIIAAQSAEIDRIEKLLDS